MGANGSPGPKQGEKLFFPKFNNEAKQCFAPPSQFSSLSSFSFDSSLTWYLSLPYLLSCSHVFMDAPCFHLCRRGTMRRWDWPRVNHWKISFSLTSISPPPPSLLSLTSIWLDRQPRKVRNQTECHHISSGGGRISAKECEDDPGSSQRFENSIGHPRMNIPERYGWIDEHQA